MSLRELSLSDFLFFDFVLNSNRLRSTNVYTSNIIELLVLFISDSQVPMSFDTSTDVYRRHEVGLAVSLWRGRIFFFPFKYSVVVDPSFHFLFFDTTIVVCF